MFAVILAALTASAYDFVSGGICYTITGDRTVEVDGIDEDYSGSVNSITIPSAVSNGGKVYQVTRIGQSAFVLRSDLRSVSIPATVTSIGMNAFFSSGLTHITIPQSVTAIGDRAFAKCNNLVIITVESGNAVYDSRNRCNAIIETATNTLLAGCRTTVIPKTVTAIGNLAFFSCTGMTSVTIPHAVTTIGDLAFNGCSDLTSVTIGCGMTSIGSGAFGGCSALTAVNCWADVPPTIQSDTFDESTYSSATLTVSFDSWSKYLTGYWNNFSNTGRKYYDFMLNGSCYFITGDNTVRLARGGSTTNCVGEVVIPSSVTYEGVTYQVTSVGMEAFYYKTLLTSVKIPNTVTSIGDDAFNMCYILESVDIPNTVTFIGREAFADCYALKKVTLPEGLTGLSYAMFKSSGITSLTIPSTVRVIGNDVFYGCSHLTSIIIPAGVTDIFSDAFVGCKRLITVTCLATTPPELEWDPDPFSSYQYENTILWVPRGCLNAYQRDGSWNKFQTIKEFACDFEVNGIYYNITGDRTVEVTRGPYSGSVDIPAMTSYSGSVYRVTAIDEFAFNACSQLSSVSIPASVTSISCYSFVGCNGLESITVASGNTVYDSRDNCSAIIETAGNRLVAGCKNTVIPSTVTEIGNFAFYACTELNSLNLPNSVTRIGNNAFSQCFGLTSITIPNSVTTIGHGAFSECEYMTDVTIGSGVTSIDDEAFNDCYRLKTVVCFATTPPAIQPNTFYSSTYSGGSLWVTEGCKSAYQAAANWSGFSSINEITYDFKVNGICYNITGSNTVEVTSSPIKYHDSVIIPSTVTYNGRTYQVTRIGTYAFENCTGLKNVVIPNSVTCIDDAAFSGSYSLGSVIIPNSVTTVGWYAFYNCGLDSLTIGKGVTTIGEHAFDGNWWMKTVTCLATAPPPITENVFDYDNYGQCTLKVPSGCKSAYQAADFWKNFYIIQELSGSRGDVNNDGQVNITDVTMLISAIMTENYSTINAANGDMNGDGNVNITDVTMLINTVMTSR